MLCPCCSAGVSYQAPLTEHVRLSERLDVFLCLCACRSVPVASPCCANSILWDRKGKPPMASKNYYSRQSAPPKSSSDSKDSGGPSSDVVNVLGKVKQLLDEQRSEKALEVITRSRLSSPWITNARGVCALRLGNAKQASGIFQGLVGHLGVMLKPDTPLVFKTNFATALLASNNTAGCLSVLHEIGKEQNPTVQRLRTAIREWKQGLSFWQKFKWYTGDYPEKPVVLSFPLGELE
jgi:hypothetical protein